MATYSRLNETGIDKLILNEIDYDQAIINYNQLQVKQLEVQLVFLEDVCVEQTTQAFITNLKDQIRSLELTILNITSIRTQPNNKMMFQQNNTFNITSFNQVYVNNILFQQQKNDSKFGLFANDSNLIDFQLFNCEFNQLISSISSKNIQQYFKLKLSTLQYTNIVLQQVQFLNIQALSQRQLIQMTTNQNLNSQLNVTLNYILINNVNFNQSSIIQLNMPNIRLNTKNLTFLQSVLINKSFVFDIQPNYISIQSNTQISSIIINSNIFQIDLTQTLILLENLQTIQASNVSMQDNIEFQFLHVSSAENVFISKVIQTQTSNQFMAPIICKLYSIFNYININEVQQYILNIQKNTIYSTFHSFEEPTFLNAIKRKIIQIMNYIDITISDSAQSLGFYLQAPTITAVFTNSSFINQDLNSPFSWICGQVKELYLHNSNFTNSILQNQYENIDNQKNGGSLYFQYCTFSNNTAKSNNDLEAKGRAVFIDGKSCFGYDVFVHQSFFLSNFASFKGGAIQILISIKPRSAIFIENVIFNNNYSLQGSNINIDSSFVSKTIVVFKYLQSQNQIEVIINQFLRLNPFFFDIYQSEISSTIGSLFSIQNTQEVQIENSQFQISCKSVENISQNLISNLIFQKILFVVNTQYYSELNNSYYESVFFENLVNVTQAISIMIYNSTVSNNKNINNTLKLTSLNSQTQNKAFFKSLNCKINQLNTTNNQCNSCSYGIIQIISQDSVIEYSIFENNVALFGAGLFVQQIQNTQNQLSPILIQNTLFKNNKALTMVDQYIQKILHCSQINQFFKCPLQCISCDDDSLCSKCVQGFYLTEDNTCISSCQKDQAYFIDNSNLNQAYYKKCGSQCQTCSNSTSCNTCKTYTYLSDNQCVNIYPNGFQSNNDLFTCDPCTNYVSPQYNPCYATCKLFISSQIGANKCNSCYETRYLQSQKCIYRNLKDQRDNFYQCSYQNIAVLDAYLSEISHYQRLILDLPYKIQMDKYHKLYVNIFNSTKLSILGSDAWCKISGNFIEVNLTESSNIMENYSIYLLPYKLQFSNYQGISIDTFYGNIVRYISPGRSQLQFNYNYIENSCSPINITIFNIQNDAGRKFDSLQWSLNQISGPLSTEQMWIQHLYYKKLVKIKIRV
ncbi:hypothetical protein ABPG72_015963 [Tetrahymena utriculariae]